MAPLPSANVSCPVWGCSLSWLQTPHSGHRVIWATEKTGLKKSSFGACVSAARGTNPLPGSPTTAHAHGKLHAGLLLLFRTLGASEQQKLLLFCPQASLTGNRLQTFQLLWLLAQRTSKAFCKIQRRLAPKRHLRCAEGLPSAVSLHTPFSSYTFILLQSSVA